MFLCQVQNFCLWKARPAPVYPVIAKCTASKRVLWYGIAECTLVIHIVYFVTVECTEGTYFDTDSKLCEYCPKGSYQNETGQTDCALCTDGTTETIGSIHKDECIGEIIEQIHPFHATVFFLVIIWYCFHTIYSMVLFFSIGHSIWHCFLPIDLLL